MSELNVYHHELRPGEYAEFYLKSEADKVIARHKYKRCLAMAEMWLERYENSTDKENAEVSWMRYEKWIKLAQKFKPNKEAY